MAMEKGRENMTTPISKATVQRLPIYLNYLKSLENAPEYVSATALSQGLALGEVQVRKDLASISDAGKPKLGYNTQNLIKVLENYLGYYDENNAVIVGVGRLGQALMAYKGFAEYGLNIVAGFDNDAGVIGKSIDGKKIYSVGDMKKEVERLGIKIGIITLPKEYAQETADKMIEAGIRGIWNFSPAHIIVPENVALKNENMASSLAVLSSQLKVILKSEQ